MDEKLQIVQKTIEDFDNETSARVNQFKDKLKELDPTKTDPSLIVNILVDAYDKKTRIKELATITALEGRTLEIKVFDRSIRNNVRDAITHYGSHFSNISSVGDALLLKLEPVTGDYLLEIYKTIKEEAEKTKTIIRDMRRKSHKKIETVFNDNKENVKKNEKKLQDSFEKKNFEISSALENFKKIHVPRALW